MLCTYHDDSNNQASVAFGRMFAFWNDAGAFWELWM